MATKKKIDETSEVGELWLSNIKGAQPLTTPKIDATLIQQYSENKYIVEGLYKQERILFEDPIEITVIDKKKNEEDQDLTQTLRDMCDEPEVDMNDALRRRWRDVMVWGCSPTNFVWGYEGREYRLKKVRILLPESFSQQGQIGFNTVKNRILPGICYNPVTKATECWQKQADGQVIKLDNIDLLIDPITKSEVGGTPFILPLVPIIRMLNFTWTKKMQEVNIYGSGGLWFLKVTDPKKDDKEYAQKILRNVSSSDRLQLRGNMEILPIGLTANGIALDTITELGMQIRRFFSPSDILSKEGDQIIGGSSAPEYQLYISYIKGTHRWLERSVQQVLNHYLVANAYDASRYLIKANIPEPRPDKTDLYLKIVEQGFRSEAMSTKARMEMLVKAGAEMEVTDEAVQLVKDEFAARAPANASPMFQKSQLMIEAMKVDKLDPNRLVEEKDARKFLHKTLGIESGEV